MWLERSAMFPSLHANIRDILDSDEDQIVQFILEPLAFPEIFESFRIHGNIFIQQLSYLTRTFAFYIDKEYKTIVKLGELNPPTQLTVNNLSNPFPAVVPCDACPVVQINSTNLARTTLQSRQSDVQSNGCQDKQVAPNRVVQAITTTVSDLYRATSAMACVASNFMQYDQSLCQSNMPCQVSPSCVGPVTAAPTSNVMYNHSNDLSHPKPDMMCMSSVSGGNNPVNSLQQEVSNIQDQYQDCTVGFRGWWGSHDNTVQVSLQPHIQYHPPPMLGT